MKLRIEQRFLIGNLLPKESNIDILRIVRQLQMDLSFSEKEHEEKFIRREGDTYTWGDPENEDAVAAAEAVNQPVDISIGDRAFHIIKGALTQANNDGLLTSEFISLYEHFVEGKEWLPNSDGQNAPT